MIGSPPVSPPGCEQAPKVNPGMAIWKGITSLFPSRLAGFQIIILLRHAPASPSAFLAASGWPWGPKTANHFPAMQFPTTRWDELAAASLDGDSGARSALDEFCRRYWPPVNAFLRWKGYSEADAADLTQDFFLNFLETRSWRRADRLRGSFRTFLLGALTHRLQKARDRSGRQKRGGGATPLSLDEMEASGSNAAPLPQAPPTDALQFDRVWAVQVLERALAATREDYASRDRLKYYDGLKPFLTARSAPPSYEETARALDLHPATVKTEIHRLRQVFRAALRLEIACTLSAPHEIDGELRHLRMVLSDHGHDLEGSGKPGTGLGEE